MNNNEIRIIISALIIYVQTSYRVKKVTKPTNEAKRLIGKMIDKLPEHNRDEWLGMAEEAGISLHELA